MPVNGGQTARQGRREEARGSGAVIRLGLKKVMVPASQLACGVMVRITSVPI